MANMTGVVASVHDSSLAIEAGGRLRASPFLWQRCWKERPFQWKKNGQLNVPLPWIKPRRTQTRFLLLVERNRRQSKIIHPGPMQQWES